MLRILFAVSISLALTGMALAQDPFEGLNAQPVALTQPAQPAQPTDPAAAGQGAPGPAAPFWGGSSHEYGRWNNNGYNRYQELQWRYDRVHQQIKQMRNWYARGSYPRRTLDRHLDYGEDLWKRYRRWMDPTSAWQLEAWLGEWERYLATSGSYHGGWNNGGWNNGGYDHGNNGYRYPDYGYYDNYRRWYYGPTYGTGDAYFHGTMLGDSIGHIVNGSRYDNNLELIGGVLGTAGNTLSIINDARGW